MQNQLPVHRYARLVALVAGLITYSVTAYNSHGYHQEDEHFQIMEPGLTVTERRPITELPWEFPAKMRPSLQIWVGLGFTKTFDAIGIHNRFTQMTLIRMLIAVLSFLLLFRLTANLTRHLDSPRARLIGLWSVGLLWFMPFLHSRFSSEHLTAIAFVAGLNLLFLAEDRKDRATLFQLAAGFFIAASFWLRFQSAFAILPLILYLAFSRRDWPVHLGFGDLNILGKTRALSILLIGALVLSAVALLADRAFYGQLVVTPWHYFSENLLQGKAATFGVSPWWSYLRSFFKAAIPPIALLGFFAIGWFIVRRHISFIAWILVVFLGVHFMIKHKELRFIFPLAIFLPAIIAEFAAFVAERSKNSSSALQHTGKFFILAVLMVNLFALVLSTFVPADIQISALKDVSDVAGKKDIPVIAAENLTLMGSNPFRFYAPSLPASIYAGEKLAPSDREYLRYIKLPQKPEQSYSGCTRITGSWWHRILPYLPENMLYTDRFTGYAILQCKP